MDKFTLVEIVSVANSRPTVRAWTPGLEQPGLATAHKLLGVTMTSAVALDPIAVMRQGYLRGCAEQNSESWVVGDILWGKSGGSITKVRPEPPVPLVAVGTVFAEESAGVFTVAVDVRVLPSLGELTNVKVEAWGNGDVLVYDETNQYWVPTTPQRTDWATTTYSADPFHNVVLCDAAGGDFTVTLPAAASSLDVRIELKKADVTRNVVTVVGAATELIEDAEAQELRLPGEALTLQCDGAQWWVV